MPGSDKGAKSAKPTDAAPHYLGHRERLRQRFLQGGSDALHDYEMLDRWQSSCWPSSAPSRK